MHNRSFFIVWGLMFFFVSHSIAQDLNFARNHIKMLTSPEFQGRGYVKKGDQIASSFLADEFKTIGLHSFSFGFFQNYNFQVNTFPGNMNISLSGKVLIPAKDFLIDPASKKCKGTFPLVTFENKWFSDTMQLRLFLTNDYRNKFILLDTAGWGKAPFKHAVWEAISKNILQARGIIEVVDSNMIFSVRTFQNDFTSLLIRRNAIPVNTKEIKIDVTQKLINHKARNLIGFIPGETDTFIVFTAHFDHLGRMGKDTYFPGANDNASGTSMVVDFAKELALKKGNHKYSYAFMLFSGEEAGLLGSQYYVEHPLFPLSKIKQVLNFDMVGAGSGGVFIFNGTNLKSEFALMDTINKTNHLGINLKIKSLSRGSDHYSFYQKQVPALFILTDGKEVGYHVPSDTYEKLPLNAYESLFKLIIQYIEAKQNGEIIYRPNTDR
jgi:aminopeptidase YwaD